MQPTSVPPPPPPPPPQPSQGGSSARTWIIVGIFAVLFLIAVVGVGGFAAYRYALNKRAQVAAQKAQIAEMETQGQEMLKEVEKSLKEGRSTEGMGDRINQIGDSLGSAAASATGKDKKGLLAAQRVMQTMSPLLASYETAYKELESAGSINPATLPTRESIATRKELVEKFGNANEAMAKFVTDMDKNVRAQLNAEGLSGSDLEEFATQFVRGANVDLNKTVRDCDRELTVTLTKVLNIFDREWGKWENRDEGLAFKNEKVEPEYNALIQELQDIAARQGEAQQELLRRARTKANTR